MIEYLKGFETLKLESYPFCIIGSGAAGISLAVSLSRRGHRVLLIEGGDWNESAEFEDTYQGQVEKPHPVTTEYRHQRFGGTTHLWGGRCVPLDAQDFEVRQHVPNSGWPLKYSEMANYYPQAMNYCDAGNADFSVSSLGVSPPPIFREGLSLRPDLLEYIERYSLPTDFGQKYREELKQSPNALVLLRARCTQLNANTDGSRIESIELSDGSNPVKINVKNIILCGGGIETTRLMLASRDHIPAWHRFDTSLGKYYACHYDLIFGSLRFKGEKPIFDFQKTTDGIYARRKLQFSAEFQNQHGLLNSAFRLHFPAYVDPSHGSGILSSIYLAKSILSSEYQAILNHGVSNPSLDKKRMKHLKNVVMDIGSVGKFGMDWLFKRKLAKRKLPYTLVANRNGTYPIEFNSEQVPDAVNRIELLDARDNHGMPRVAVHWKMTDLDIQSGIRSFTLLQEMFGKTQACRLEFDPKSLEEKVANALPVGGHHIGSTRMGDSPDNSVVDRDCKVHGVENLFIASASVFTTNSHANPTLTIVATALRLADHLDKAGSIA